MIQFEYSCRWHPRVTTVARALSLVLLLTSLSAAQTRESKHVLILMQEDVSSSVYRVIDENARISLHAGSPEGVLISSEHLDRNHFPVPEIQAEQVAWIKKKYANSGLDLIITVGDVPTDLFPGVPLVTLSADPRRRPPSRTTPATAYASVWVALEAQKTLELALRLQPGARRIMVIGDGSPPEDSTLTRLQQMYPTRIGNTPITYVANPVVSEISHRVSELGSDNIVLFTALTQDGHGHPLISTDAMARIAAASGAPVYAILDTHIGTGAVGGYVTSFAEVGKAGGQLGLRLLAGERPKDIEAPNVFEFDSRQLRRWKIPESSLPAGSVVLFRQPSIWETYRWYIIGGALLCLLQAVLILGLLWQRSTRRHAEASLIERLAFERLLSDLSKIFINLPEEQVDTTIEQSLPRIAEFLRIDRITVHEFFPERSEFAPSITWRRDGAQPAPVIVTSKQLSWWTNHFLRGEAFFVSGVDELPKEASPEREYLRQISAVSIATLPFAAGSEFLGCISFVSTSRRVDWTPGLADQLKLLAAIFSNALARKRAQLARFRHAAIVESSDDAIVFNNLDGIIASWNAGAQRLYGYSETEAVGNSITMLLPAQLREEEGELLRRLRAGERVEHYETERIAKNGTRVAVSLTISPLRDSNGKVFGYSNTARDITDRKRAEQDLRESEQRFRLVADSAPVLIWMSGTDKLCDFFNQGWLSFTGRRIEDELGEGWASGVHPEDLQRCLQLYSSSFDARRDFEMEYRLRRFDGEFRWIVDYGAPRFGSDGTFCGYIGSCVDITERKMSAESLNTLSGRLIQAQDEERERIARELHDDFSQSLALQCIDIEQLRKRLPALEGEDQARLTKMLKRAKAMAADIRSLSHELYSSRLELIGLLPAISGLCKEIGEKYNIAVEFAQGGIAAEIPKDVALCLFRVAQEALGNVVKHSEARSARVEFAANASGVSLRISDEGRGFDLGLTNPGVGIGLVGMKERLRLVGGRLSVRSELLRGTEILAEVPLSTSANAAPSQEERQSKAAAAGGWGK